MANITGTFAILGYIFVAILSLIIILVAVYNSKTILKLFSLLLTSIISIFNPLNNQPIYSDICAVIPGTTISTPRIPSMYIAHIVFFTSFLATNAYNDYYYETDSNAPKAFVANRKMRSLMTLIMLIVFCIGLIVARYFLTDCESILGILLTTSIFSVLGYSWYVFAKYCGSRDSDILGMIPGFVPDSAQQKPLACRVA